MTLKRLSIFACTALATATFASDPVECSSNPAFLDNGCDVCQRSVAAPAQSDGTNYTTEIKNIEFDWENTSDTYHELIYQGEQTLPSIQSNLSFTTSPTDEASIWKYGEQVLWTEYEGVQEFYTEPGSKIVFRKMNQNSVVSISQADAPAEEGFVLLSSALTYRDFDVESFEESDSQVRTFCELVEVPFEVAMTEPEPEVELEAAPQEPEMTDPEPEVELEAAGPSESITSNQTATQSGPEHIIIVVAALALWYIFIRRKKVA